MPQYFAQIITKTDCPYCVQAKDFMTGMEIQYSEMIVGKDCKWEDVKAKLPNATTVPQIWINGQHVGGYEELVNWAAAEA